MILCGVVGATILVGTTLDRARRHDELPVLAQLPSFSLVDQNAQPFSSTTVRGRVWIASFIYTTCPGPCPLVVRRIKDLIPQFAGSEAPLFVSVSVDPQQDTPARLAEYATAHGIDTDRWTLVTGEVEDVISFVREGFLLGVGLTAELLGDDATEEGIARAVSADGPVAHSIRLALVDTEQRVRGYYDSADENAVAQLAADARGLLRAP